MFRLSENFISVAGLIVLISFLFRYYLSDMVGVMAIVAIAFILFYFYSHLFECIVRKDWNPITKDIQTNVILFLLLLLLLGSILGQSSDPRNAFRIMAIFLALYLVVKLVLIEYYLNREAEAELQKEQDRIRMKSGIRKRHT